MRCEDAIEQIQTAGTLPGGDLRAAIAHATECDDCHAALRALETLQLFRDDAAPPPSDGAVDRAIDRAIHGQLTERNRRSFWGGVASGAALAATLAALAVALWWSPAADVPAAVPEVRMALNMPQNVTVTLESPEPLADAEVRVELRGAVALDGYGGQRELRWSTSLDQGVNQLTLPVVALDAAGGQVLVEVAHGARRRTFVLDVRAPVAG